MTKIQSWQKPGLPEIWARVHDFSCPLFLVTKLGRKRNEEKIHIHDDIGVDVSLIEIDRHSFTIAHHSHTISGNCKYQAGVYLMCNVFDIHVYEKQHQARSFFQRKWACQNATANVDPFLTVT
jgi:hypothetical protein